MIAISDALKSLLIERRPHRVFDLWTFTLTCGITLRWTSADIDLTVGGQSYSSAIRISRDKLRLTTGVETATLQTTISPDPAAEPQINGVPLRQAIRGGLFDGAAVRLESAYYNLDLPPQKIGRILRFCGTVGDLDAFAAKAVLTINSPLKRLDLQIPWKLYGAGCRHVLGDVDCGVNLSAYAVPGQVLAGSTNGTVITSLSGEPSYTGGTLVLTSGPDATFRRTIRTQSGQTLALKNPLPWAPAAGESFTILPGCNKTKAVVTPTSLQATIPTGLTLAAVTDGTFGEDRGATLIGLTHSVEIGRDEYGAPLYNTTTDPNIVMVKVGENPAAGQYSVTSAGVYHFSTANLGRQVTLSFTRILGGSGGCRQFGNLARFGGMPYIPSPETAY